MVEAAAPYQNKGRLRVVLNVPIKSALLQETKRCLAEN